MKAELVPENGDPPIPITRDLVLVGRRSYCDIVIDHPSLSKRHCVLVKTDGLLVIRDLISTNGTKVKGQKIRWAALLPDDRIAVGSYKLRVYYGPDDVPGPSERYKARSERAGATARQQASTGPWPGQALPAGSPAQASRPAEFSTTARAGSSGPESFPAPSPLEIVVGSSEHEISARDLVDSPPGKRLDAEPLLPIVLDDSDELIDLD
jgi:predicted component of type VI protein secretion system